MVHRFRSYFMLTALAPLFSYVIAFAQVDPEKALIGVWEGQAEVSQNRERTLELLASRPRAAVSGLAGEDSAKQAKSIPKRLVATRKSTSRLKITKYISSGLAQVARRRFV